MGSCAISERDPAATALLVWCVAFALPHVAWALGARWGLGAEAAAADAALATPWFAAYNAVTALLCLAGAAVAVLVLAGRPEVFRRLRAALLVAGVLLALRAVVGVASLAVDVATGRLDSPPLLVAVEGWFVLGAAVLLWCRRAGSRLSGRATPR